MKSYFKFFKQKQKNWTLKSTKIICAIVLFLLPGFTYGVTQQDLNNISNQLNNAKKNLKNIQNQRKNLQDEITYYNSQINYAEAQISAIEYNLSQLNSSILRTSKSIQETENELKKNKDNLAEIIRNYYEEGQTSNIELIAQSKNFSDFVNRAEYLASLQLTINNVVLKITEIKTNLENKKNELEEQKRKQEDLRNQQYVYKNQVISQKSAKDQLLKEVKGDELAYQALVKKLTAEYYRVQSELWNNVRSYVSIGKVKRGDVIGIMGNSGYSTGCHLHFEIRDSSQKQVNPASYINNGYFIHPAPNTVITAPYGYSGSYFSGVFHTGIDYADGCRGTRIRAAADGDIIKRVTGYGNTYPYKYIYGNYVLIRHTNGMYSLYAHLR